MGSRSTLVIVVGVAVGVGLAGGHLFRSGSGHKATAVAETASAPAPLGREQMARLVAETAAMSAARSAKQTVARAATQRTLARQQILTGAMQASLQSTSTR